MQPPDQQPVPIQPQQPQLPPQPVVMPQAYPDPNAVVIQPTVVAPAPMPAPVVVSGQVAPIMQPSVAPVVVSPQQDPMAQVPVQQVMPQAFVAPQPGVAPVTLQSAQPSVPVAGAVPLPAQPGVEEPSLVISRLHRLENIMKPVVVVAVLAISTFSIVGSMHIFSVRRAAYDQLSWVKNDKNNANFGPEIESRSDGSLDMSKKVDVDFTAKKQDLKIGLNQQANLTDGNSLMVTGVDRNWQPVGDFEEPKPGNIFIKIDLLHGNRATKQISGFLSLDAFSADGTSTKDPSEFLIPSDLHPGEVDLGASDFDNYDPGEVRKGILVLNVPPSTTRIVFHDDYWGQYVRAGSGNYGSKQEKVVQKVEITLP